MGPCTPLHSQHLALGAHLIDFAGWRMPLHYGSRLEEHRQVRRDCGVFDVSHMTVIDLQGPQATEFLRRVLAGDVARLVDPGKACYSVLLNEHGGVVDDSIVYLTASGYRLVLNAVNRAKDIAWLQRHAGGFAVTLRPRDDLALLAIQGPTARARVAGLSGAARASLIRELAPFQGADEGGWFVARTGYTGEDGLEIFLPADEAPELFAELVGAGIPPIGLGARETLRLEAGLNLYGHEMDEDTSPLAANLGWTIAWEPAGRDFIGRAALLGQQVAGALPRLAGLVLEERGLLRAGQAVRVAGLGEGVISSGGYSPTLGQSIALARVPAATGARAEVCIHGRWLPVRVVRPGFVRHGKPLI
jgi:aminomethyltransferase